jgi:hypothetical protein
MGATSLGCARAVSLNFLRIFCRIFLQRKFWRGFRGRLLAGLPRPLAPEALQVPARPRRRLVAAYMLRDRVSGHRGLCGRPRRLSRPTFERLCGMRCGVPGCRTFSGFRRCGALEMACRTTGTFHPRKMPAQSRSPCPSLSQLATCHSPASEVAAISAEHLSHRDTPLPRSCRRR